MSPKGTSSPLSFFGGSLLHPSTPAPCCSLFSFSCSIWLSCHYFLSVFFHFPPFLYFFLALHPSRALTSYFLSLPSRLFCLGHEGRFSYFPPPPPPLVFHLQFWGRRLETSSAHTGLRSSHKHCSQDQRNRETSRA
ncbi:hypothetical protein Q5P01_011710 [Channa striata]|uniref:Uncharacterized protein n=1 Tax=Channa striata TaxID=64152 RepID=A0AA88SPG6_CHASR|nr:hypothetical protein Q5P01_011710 [Channa striata]